MSDPRRRWDRLGAEAQQVLKESQDSRRLLRLALDELRRTLKAIEAREEYDATP